MMRTTGAAVVGPRSQTQISEWSHEMDTAYAFEDFLVPEWHHTSELSLHGVRSLHMSVKTRKIGDRPQRQAI